MNIEIEDYLDEAKTKSLVRELKKRDGYENIDVTSNDIRQLMESEERVEKFNKLSTIDRVKLILHLKPYATKAEIINEINEL